MLRRAWTLVMAYMACYFTFDAVFRNDRTVARVFPQHPNRNAFLIFGYAMLLLGLTEVATWALKYAAYVANRHFYPQYYPHGFHLYQRHVVAQRERLRGEIPTDPDIRHTPSWVFGEIIYWYLTAYASICLWAYAGTCYDFLPQKMFAMGTFFGCLTKYAAWMLGIE